MRAQTAGHLLLGPGGRRGSIASCVVERLELVDRAARSCHGLRSEGLESLCGLLARVGSGDEEAVRKLGCILTVDEAKDATAMLRADFALLALDDDPDLAVPALQAAAPARALLHELPFATAEALRWLAWHEAWLTALTRAGGGNRPLLVEEGAARTGLPPAERLRPAVRQRLAERARGAFQAACGESLAELSGDVVEALAAASAAAARHTAARVVHPKCLEEARNAWADFAGALQKLKGAGALGDDLRDDVKWLCWNVSWHASHLVRQHQGAGDDDDDDDDGDREGTEEEEEEDAELFGDEDYPGIDSDPLKNLARFLHHALRLHRGQGYGLKGEPWRGLVLPAAGRESAPRDARAAGFNTLRLPVASARVTAEEALQPLRPLLAASAKAGVDVVLDLLGCSMRGSQGQDALCKCLVGVGAAVAACGGPRIRGVALPRATSPQAAAALVEALRAGGLGPEACAAILQLDDPAVDEDGEYTGFIRKVLCQGEQGLLLTDGHVVFEVYRRPPERVDSPVALLDAASASGGLEELLPMSCFRWGLAVPASLARECSVLGDCWKEELASRWEAGSANTTHGWFAVLDDVKSGSARIGIGASLQSCLQRRWHWPDPLAERVLWPHEHQHRATLVYLHGFTCDGASYLPCHDYFHRAFPIPSLTGESEEEDGEQEYIYVPFDGLKVVLPSAPIRPVTCCGGQLLRSWYDYKTDYEGSREDELDVETLEEAVARIHRVLDAESAALRGSERVLLGGASQGAGVALHAALSYAGRLGGVCSTQGQLLSLTKIPLGWGARGTPVRVYHGLADTTLPWSWVGETFKRLESANVDVSMATDEGVDHGDDEAEGRWVRAFLAEMWERWGFDSAVAND